MKTEYEVRFLEIDVRKITEKLEELGAKKIGDWEQKRYVYDIDDGPKNKWVRLRTNGEITTITYKEIINKQINGTKEIEFEVKDFENANEFLKKIGLRCKRYEENNRIRYVLGNVEFDIDSWPKIPTYLEIEGKDEKDVIDAVRLLRLDESKLVTTNVMDLYKQYGYDLDQIDILKF